MSPVHSVRTTPSNGNVIALFHDNENQSHSRYLYLIFLLHVGSMSHYFNCLLLLSSQMAFDQELDAGYSIMLV